VTYKVDLLQPSLGEVNTSTAVSVKGKDSTNGFMCVPCLCVCACVCVYVCVCVRTRVMLCLMFIARLGLCAFVHIYHGMCVCMYVCVHVYEQPLFQQQRTHAQTHTHTHTHTSHTHRRNIPQHTSLEMQVRFHCSGWCVSVPNKKSDVLHQTSKQAWSLWRCLSTMVCVCMCVRMYVCIYVCVCVRMCA